MNKSKSRLLRRFFAQRYRTVAVALAGGFAAGICSLLLPLLVGRYYNLALETGSPRGRLLKQLPLSIDSLDALFLVFAVTVVLHFIFSFVARQFAELSGEYFVRELRERLFERQLSAPFPDMAKQPPGRQLLRFTGDMSAVKRLISKGFIGTTNDLFLILPGFTLLFYLSTQLATLILLLTVSFSVAFIAANQRLFKTVSSVRSTRSSNMAFVSSRLHAMLTIKLMRREKQEMRKFARRSAKLFARAKGWLLVENFQRAAVPFLMHLLLLSVLVYGHYLFNQPEPAISAGALLVFIMFLLSITPACRRLLLAKRHWRDGLLSLEKVAERLQQENTGKATELQAEKGRLHMAGFQMRADGGRQLCFPGFVARRGLLNLLLAGSGAGKSRLLAMLAGLEAIPAETAFLDDEDLALATPEAIRQNVALFTSDAPLLGNTVAGVLGNPRNGQRQKALDLLQRFGMKFTTPEALKTDIGDHGSRLAAGEIHILQLVRTLLSPREIMLFDDPFAGLPAEACTVLGQILNELKSRHTLVLALREKPGFPGKEAVSITRWPLQKQPRAAHHPEFF